MSRLPARQLIGPLYLANALVLAPAAPFAVWTYSPRIMLLHGIAVALMSLTALAVFDLFDHGRASSVTTAQALSPLPAVLAAVVLVPGSLEPLHALAAVSVVVGVLCTLSDVFGDLGRLRSLGTALVAATGAGTLTVVSKLLSEASVGLVQDYVVRTTCAGAVFVLACPPRAIALPRELPGILLRALFVTASFSLMIVGVQRGSPAVVQTTFATTPLFVIGYEVVAERRLPSVRVVVALALVLAGVGAVF